MYVGTLIDDEIDLEHLRKILDELGHVGRVATIRGWTARQQARIYEAAKGFMAIDLDFFVPPGVEPLTEVAHDGGNTVPVFDETHKRFCKPPLSESGAPEVEGELWGYNLVSGFLHTLIGPGYFVAHAAPDAGEIDIDYARLPPKKLDAWPPIAPNDARVSRFVYNNLLDRMRGLSTHVSIGRAYRSGQPLDQYFVICREDPKPA